MRAAAAAASSPMRLSISSIRAAIVCAGLLAEAAQQRLDLGGVALAFALRARPHARATAAASSAASAFATSARDDRRRCRRRRGGCGRRSGAAVAARRRRGRRGRVPKSCSTSKSASAAISLASGCAHLRRICAVRSSLRSTMRASRSCGAGRIFWRRSSSGVEPGGRPARPRPRASASPLSRRPPERAASAAPRRSSGRRCAGAGLPSAATIGRSPKKATQEDDDDEGAGVDHRADMLADRGEHAGLGDSARRRARR